MITSEHDLFMHRSRCFYHSKRRLRERYGIHLNIDSWLRINNSYWLNKVEHKVIHPDDPCKELVILPMFSTHLVGVFNKDINVFCTFLDPDGDAGEQQSIKKVALSLWDNAVTYS